MPVRNNIKKFLYVVIIVLITKSVCLGQFNEREFNRLVDMMAKNPELILNDDSVFRGYLNDLTFEKLRTLRNTIFAKHGHVFKDSVLQSYFESKKWYKKSNQTINLSIEEQEVIKIIQAVENEEKERFNEFISKFPSIDLPFKQDNYELSDYRDPMRLDSLEIVKYLSTKVYEAGWWIVPYFQIPTGNDYLIIVYKEGMAAGGYDDTVFLVTLKSDGEFIDRIEIGSYSGDLYGNSHFEFEVLENLRINVFRYLETLTDFKDEKELKQKEVKEWVYFQIEKDGKISRSE